MSEEQAILEPRDHFLRFRIWRQRQSIAFTANCSGRCRLKNTLLYVENSKPLEWRWKMATWASPQSNWRKDDANSLYLPKDNVCRTTHSNCLVYRQLLAVAFDWESCFWLDAVWCKISCVRLCHALVRVSISKAAWIRDRESVNRNLRLLRFCLSPVLQS